MHHIHSPLRSIGLHMILMLPLFVYGCGKESGEEKEPVSSFEERFPDLYLSTESESSERAAILPTEGSEDATAVIGVVSLPEDESSDADGRDYLPELQTEWVITVSPATDTTLNVQEVGESCSSNTGSRELSSAPTSFRRSRRTS